jgi:hypothetical protein
MAQQHCPECCTDFIRRNSGLTVTKDTSTILILAKTRPMQSKHMPVLSFLFLDFSCSRNHANEISISTAYGLGIRNSWAYDHAHSFLSSNYAQTVRKSDRPDGRQAFADRAVRITVQLDYGSVSFGAEDITNFKFHRFLTPLVSFSPSLSVHWAVVIWERGLCSVVSCGSLSPTIIS